MNEALGRGAAEPVPARQRGEDSERQHPPASVQRPRRHGPVEHKRAGCREARRADVRPRGERRARGVARDAKLHASLLHRTGKLHAHGRRVLREEVLHAGVETGRGGAGGRSGVRRRYLGHDLGVHARRGLRPDAAHRARSQHRVPAPRPPGGQGKGPQGCVPAILRAEDEGVRGRNLSEGRSRRHGLVGRRRPHPQHTRGRARLGAAARGRRRVLLARRAGSG